MSIVVTAIPVSTLIIFAISFALTLFTTGLNRILIARLIGWDEYRSMQREMKEYQSESMKAARSNDVKQMEKLKKKQSQITAMQTKMMKPQFIMMGLSMVTLLLWWLVLLPLYGTVSVAIVPGIGGIPLFYWYFICSLFFSTLLQRVLGTNPMV